MALGINSAGTLAQVLMDGTTQTLYTVPTGTIAVIKEILFNVTSVATITYWIGGSADVNMHLPPTAVATNKQLRDIINMPLAAGTVIYGLRDASGVVGVEILGTLWNV